MMSLPPRVDRAKWRTFTTECTAAIPAEYHAADRDERGASVRRERRCSSHIDEWRKAVDNAICGAAEHRRAHGRSAPRSQPRSAERSG